jgi:hypothetical protein
MSKDLDFPPVSKSLLESLEGVYPKKDFDCDTPSNYLVFHYGQRSVVNFLRHQYEIQNDNILNTKIK